ncbi:hypothetical protein Rsub_09352 [Raphidocelis subcapitata]|uniref:Alpha-soluble NSF attachment protein n=1 Tax=Raphidocelis subcapitata TaxID=307507 RepID=A0A2V0P9T6_9CHLO|nr:hypothetical protein Rsub_09352 [Raphidocelis subcapitata]|eukprot:GBF96606.1 hypothetical protein Rsub_09352 [Raphidocelis subcapitata]
MADAVGKGDAFMAAADKKLKSFGFFGNKYEEAAELLEKAANNYKLGKAWRPAAEAYKQLAAVQMKLDSKHDAASSYVEGAKALMKASPAEAVPLLQQAVEVYTDMGRLNMAARQLREIAEAQEKQGLKEEACLFYSQAADLFATENSGSEANRCRLKVAEFSAELEKYAEAAEIYEDVARAAADNNLLRFGARGHLLCAGVCVLCHASDEEVRTRLDRYRDIDLQTNMLLKVKRRLQARASGEERGAESDEEVL